MDSRLSGIEQFIIFLGVRKNFFFFFMLQKIMNHSIPLRRESIKILLSFLGVRIFGMKIRREY